MLRQQQQSTLKLPSQDLKPQQQQTPPPYSKEYLTIRNLAGAIRNNTRTFFWILLIIGLAILALAIFNAVWTNKVLTSEQCPTPVCNVNVTCPPPICNGTVTANLTCPVPIFNGTVDFEGTVDFNGTVNVNTTCPPPICNGTVVANLTCPVPTFNGTVSVNTTCPVPVCNETILNNVTCPVPIFNGTVEFNGTVSCPTPEFNGTVYFNGTVVAGNGTCVVNTTCNCPVPVFNGTVDFNGTVSVNTTCPVPICNGTVSANLTCPVPIFNGTVDFNGTVSCPTPVVNVTVNSTANLIRNNTACNIASTKFHLGKPCAVPLYDPINQVCVTGESSGFWELDGTACAANHPCYDHTFSPVCRAGRCFGFSRGICLNVTDGPFYNCPDLESTFSSLYRGKSIYLSSTILVTTQCLLWADSAVGSNITTSIYFDPDLFGNVETITTTFQNTTTLFAYGYCAYTVRLTREINSDAYAGMNETFIPPREFCYNYLGYPYSPYTIPYPPENLATDVLPCLDVIDAKAVTQTISDTSPYRVKVIYECQFAFKSSRKNSQSFNYLML